MSKKTKTPNTDFWFFPHGESTSWLNGFSSASLYLNTCNPRHDDIVSVITNAQRAMALAPTPADEAYSLGLLAGLRSAYGI